METEPKGNKIVDEIFGLVNRPINIKNSISFGHLSAIDYEQFEQVMSEVALYRQSATIWQLRNNKKRE